MTVRELVAILSAMPQDALVIHTMCSDYCEMEPGDVTLKPGRLPDGGGLIRHHGHLMDLRADWWPPWNNLGPRPAEPEYVVAVHFAGN